MAICGDPESTKEGGRITRNPSRIGRGRTARDALNVISHTSRHADFIAHQSLTVEFAGNQSARGYGCNVSFVDGRLLCFREGNADDALSHNRLTPESQRVGCKSAGSAPLTRLTRERRAKILSFDMGLSLAICVWLFRFKRSFFFVEPLLR